MTEKKRLVEQVDSYEEEMLDFLEKVVNFDSPSTNKAQCDGISKVFAAKAEEFGLAVEVDAQEAYGDNLVARNGAESDTRPRVLMVGHMDTVFESETTSERPFTREGNRAFGPGVFDMKAGLVIGLYAIRVAKELSEEWNLPITFIFNSDEEPGSPHSRTVIEREAVKHDLALILEPGQDGPAITNSRKGVAIFSLESIGRAAHAGVEPEKGINSIVDLAARIGAVSALADPEQGTTLNVGVVSGGSQPYVVPSSASCRIDVRVTNVDEQRRIEEELQKIADQEFLPGATCTLSGNFHRPPFAMSDEARAYIERLQQIAADLDFPLGLSGSGGASDGNLAAGLGVPTIDGLGAHGGFAHRPDEYIEVDTVARKTAILGAFLMDLNQRN